MSREEHAQRMRELNMKRSMMRAPRRGWSMTDYQGDHAPTHSFHATAAHVDRQVSIPENAVLPSPAMPPASSTMDESVQIPRRPKMPPPRRSYSVTDKEPEPVAPGQPRPSGRMTILDLPSELHYSLFDFLDPIDGVCLGSPTRGCMPFTSESTARSRCAAGTRGPTIENGPGEALARSSARWSRSATRLPAVWTSFVSRVRCIAESAASLDASCTGI